MDNVYSKTVIRFVRKKIYRYRLKIVGQGPAVLAAGAGRVGYIYIYIYIYIFFFFFFFFFTSSISNVLSFGRRLTMIEILSFRLLNPNGSCQLLPRTSSLGTS